jgi:hypothetical protein
MALVHQTAGSIILEGMGKNSLVGMHLYFSRRLDDEHTGIGITTNTTLFYRASLSTSTEN